MALSDHFCKVIIISEWVIWVSNANPVATLVCICCENSCVNLDIDILYPYSLILDGRDGEHLTANKNIQVQTSADNYGNHEQAPHWSMVDLYFGVSPVFGLCK